MSERDQPVVNANARASASTDTSARANANASASASASASAAELAHAIEVLAQQGLVAFPTETVYGLGADAESALAVERIYQAKGRPSNHPVIVHVTPEADLLYWAATVPPEAQLLIDAFWPGPLTLILKRAAHISSVVSGGQDSIGLRCPSHRVAQALLRGFAATRASGQGGVAGPSANKFGQVSPTTAAHVRHEFPELVAQGMPVLEGGASDVGIESTIVDLSRLDQGVGPVLLRPGHITAAQLAEVLNQEVAEPDAQAPRVSGALKSHYAPQTPLRLLSLAELPDVVAAQKAKLEPGQRVAVVTHTPEGITPEPNQQLDWITLPNDPAAYSRVLYATLRALDQQGYSQLLWQQPPTGLEWAGVQDRLGRAAAGFS
ncbi:SUA5 Putative translation factor (SUA5) [Burkholderiaceae bacterium]